MTDTDVNPARGCIHGALLAAAFWVALVALWWWVA